MNHELSTQGQQFYLRVEGVNLENFVFDTRDLSTIRGGGLTLLAAVGHARRVLGKAPDVVRDSCQPLSEGASVGLFCFCAASRADAERVRAYVEAALLQAAQRDQESHSYSLPCHQATFVVDVLAEEPVPEDSVVRATVEASLGEGRGGATPETDPRHSSAPAQARFVQVHEGLIALNRFRQMRSSTLAVPHLAAPHLSGSTRICDVDGLRPAAPRPGRRAGEVEEFWSSSVRSRRRYGCDQKQRLYKHLLLGSQGASLRFEHEFAREFADIARRNRSDPDRSLDGKMAVFYADGNSFGRHQQELCVSPRRQRAWDEFLRGKRRELLRRLLGEEVTAKVDWLRHRSAESSGMQTASKAAREGRSGLGSGPEPQCAACYRFETLLWGGDELLFVVPAWLGFRVARIFFEEVAHWNARDVQAPGDSKPPLDFADRRLTHSAALVFCHYRAPIHRVKHLAKDQLTEFAKSRGSRERNQLVYQVLESFDHLGTDLELAWRQRLGGNDRGALPRSMVGEGEGSSAPTASTDSLAVLSRLILSDAPGDESPEGSLGARLRRLTDAVAALRRSDFPRSQLRALVTELARDTLVKTSLGDCLLRFTKTGSPSDRKQREDALATLASVLGDDWALWWHLEELWDYARP